MLKTPILIIAFSRPELLEKQLLKLANVVDRNIYIHVDGLRNSLDLNVINCRVLINDFSVNRKNVFVKIQIENLGVKHAPIAAINWAFTNEKTLIIFEDDIVWAEEFFEFADYCLNEYEDKLDIWQVNGWTPLQVKHDQKNPYLTIYSHTWGWATWKSRWSHMDLELENLESNPVFYLRFLQDKKLPYSFFQYWQSELDRIQKGFQSWDAQWLYSSWLSGAFSISPPEKLTGNVGFDGGGTNTLGITVPEWVEVPGLLVNFSNWNLKRLTFSERALKLHNEISFGITPEYTIRSTVLWRLVTTQTIKKRVPRVLLVFLNNFLKKFRIFR